MTVFEFKVNKFELITVLVLGGAYKRGSHCEPLFFMVM